MVDGPGNGSSLGGAAGIGVATGTAGAAAAAALAGGVFGGGAAGLLAPGGLASALGGAGGAALGGGRADFEPIFLGGMARKWAALWGEEPRQKVPWLVAGVCYEGVPT